MGDKTLEEQLIDRLKLWLQRVTGPGLDTFGKTFSVTLNDRQGDEDGTLYLEANIEETDPSDIAGRVPGRTFE